MIQFVRSCVTRQPAPIYPHHRRTHFWVLFAILPSGWATTSGRLLGPPMGNKLERPFLFENTKTHCQFGNQTSGESATFRSLARRYTNQRWPDPHIKRSKTDPDATRSDLDPIRILNLLNFEIQTRSWSASIQLRFVHFNEYFDKH